MIKTKEKVCLMVFLFGILVLICSFFYGCRSGDLFCYFVSEDEIVLMTNSSFNTKEIKIETNTQYDISWDGDIIEYNTQTGEVTAKNEGKTKLTISYKKDGKTYSQSISVVVIEPVFAVDIELEEDYIFYEGSSNNKLECNVVTQNGKEYNLDLLCESLNPLCFQTDKNMIIPQTTGTAKLVAKAISGYDVANKKFLYIQKETMVHIVPQIRNLSIKLCDKTFNELESAERVDLFYDDSTFDYYLKLEGDASIQYYQVKKANDNQFFEICDGEVLSGLENIRYIPIKLTNYGNSSIRLNLLKQNNNSAFVSGEILICSHKYISDADIKLYSAGLNKSKDEFKGEINNSFVPLAQNKETGKYDLYKITNDANYFNLALQNKKYFNGIICFDNFDANCYNEINAEATSIKLEKLSQNRFYFEVIESGNASISFSAVATDQKEFQKTIEFNVQNVEPSSYFRVQENQIVLGLNEEKDFAVSNVIPAYAYVPFSVELQNNNGVLEIDGTKVVAKSYGNETVVVTICGEHFEYSVLVEPETDVAVQIVNQQNNNGYYVELEILGTYQSIKGLVVLEDEDASVVRSANRIYVSSNICFERIEVTIETSLADILRVVVVNWENT